MALGDLFNMGAVTGSNSRSFNPEKDIPDLSGKVILVTGGNVGLGKDSIIAYARHNPAQIWMGSRNLEKAKVAVADIQAAVPNAPIHILPMDLADLSSVKKAADEFVSKSDRLDILMLNAGIMATPAGLTKDGYERQFGTNHMGHALFTKRLLPVLDRTAALPGADVRVVVLSSHGEGYAPKGGIQFDTLKSKAESLGGIACYGQSKLANILFARQFAKNHPNLTVASVHPGLVKTNLYSSGSEMSGPNRFLMSGLSFMYLTPEEGCRHQLWASVNKDVKNGEFYKPLGVAGLGTPHTRDEKLAEKLWEWTEKELATFA